MSLPARPGSAWGPLCIDGAIAPNRSPRKRRCSSTRGNVSHWRRRPAPRQPSDVPPTGTRDDHRMKIAKLTTFLVPPRWCFLKIETDEGITGWGEPVLEGRAETVAAAVSELADYLIGKDPSPIEDHWTVLYRGGFYRGGGVHMSALAGIDQALWDIKGKALGVPVHKLLGGPVRDRIRVYSWIGGDRPADTAE